MASQKGSIALLVLLVIILVVLFAVNFMVLNGKFNKHNDDEETGIDIDTQVETESESVLTEPETEAYIETVKETERETEKETEKETERQTECETEADTSAYIEGPDVIAGAYASQVKESPAVDDSYFDDALFIGDSRMVDFCKRTGLSNCYAAVSLGMFSASKLRVIDVVQDDNTVASMTVCDALALNKDKYTKIYICLGINDHAADPDTFASAMVNFVAMVKEAANPGTIIYVESLLPVNEQKAAEKGYHVTNERVKGLNDAMAAACPATGAYFVHTAEALMTDGVFSVGYDVSNDGIHFNGSEYRKVKAYLATHTVG